MDLSGASSSECIRVVRNVASVDGWAGVALFVLMVSSRSLACAVEVKLLGKLWPRWLVGR